MKRIGLIIVVIIAVYFTAVALEVPYLSGHINDEAHLLSAETVSQLESLLTAYEDSTGNQIALLTISTLDGESLEEFSLRVAETWKLGQKGVDNGALLLIAKDDRKLRIEVGYGLEASLTDAMTSFIIDGVITPRFKQGDFETGIREGLQSMIDVADGTLSEGDITYDSGDEFPMVMFFVVWFSIVGIFTLMGITMEGCMGWTMFAFLIPFYLAPAFIASEETHSPIGWFIFIGYLILYPILHYFLPKTEFGKNMAKKAAANAARGGSWSSSSGSSSSSSSWFSGGGSSSSGSSFSGGGGSFGGGGSSGSW